MLISLYFCPGNGERPVMITRTAIWCSAVLWLLSGPHALAQSTQQLQAETALLEGDPPRAAALAQDMIDQNPDSFAGLFLLALAQAELEDNAASAQSAAAAYRVATDSTARVQTARLVARNRIALRQYMRAEFWLRRAANDITNDTEAEAVVRDYVRAIEANPLSTQFTAYIAPSDNINGGSEDGIVRFDGTGVFPIFGGEDLENEFVERSALSGIEFGGSARLDYRLTQNDAQTTRLGGFLSGRTYRLSPEARDRLDSSPTESVRAIRGDDFATLQLELGATHTRNALLPFGPTSFRLTYGTYGRGGERLVDYRDTVLTQGFKAERGTFGLRLSRRDQTALLNTLVDEVTDDVIGSYTTRLPNDDTVQFSLAYRYSDAGFENTYEEYRAGLNYRFDQPIWGTQLRGSLQIGRRSYDEFITTIDGRRDRFASIGIDATFTEFSYFGFSPNVSFTASRNESTAEEESNSILQILVGIESNF